MPNPKTKPTIEANRLGRQCLAAGPVPISLIGVRPSSRESFDQTELVSLHWILRELENGFRLVGGREVKDSNARSSGSASDQRLSPRSSEIESVFSAKAL